MGIKLQHPCKSHCASFFMRLMFVGLVILISIVPPNLAGANGDIGRANISSSGVEANGATFRHAISDNGRYVAFQSAATNLVPNDTNGRWDTFVHDRQTGVTTRVSVSSSDVQGNHDSNEGVSLSADGRYVAFASRASNLDPAWRGPLFNPHIYIHDRQQGTTRELLTPQGIQEFGFSGYPTLSRDGRYVAFSSASENWDGWGGNAFWRPFIHNLITGETIRAKGINGWPHYDAHSIGLSLSDDGNLVAFHSSASNMVLGDTNGVQDVFVFDRNTDASIRVSVSSAGQQANGPSDSPSLSGDGQYVAFASRGTLVSNDTNVASDVFVHNLQTAETIRVSVSSAGDESNGHSGGPSLSADGRYVAFSSDATNLVPGDTNGQTDVFIHDRQTGETTRVSVPNSNTEGNGASSGPVISGNGQEMVFQSWASNLVPADTNNALDVFARTAPGVALTITPSSTTAVLGTGTVQFSATGGDGNYTFEFVDNISGGTIDMNTGLYTAGSLTTGIDRVQVRDGTGITAEAIITVIDVSFLVPILYLLGC